MLAPRTQFRHILKTQLQRPRRTHYPHPQPNQDVRQTSGLPYSTESEKLYNEICEQCKHMLNFCWFALAIRKTIPRLRIRNLTLVLRFVSLVLGCKCDGSVLDCEGYCTMRRWVRLFAGELNNGVCPDQTILEATASKPTNPNEAWHRSFKALAKISKLVISSKMLAR